MNGNKRMLEELSKRPWLTCLSIAALTMLLVWGTTRLPSFDACVDAYTYSHARQRDQQHTGEESPWGPLNNIEMFLRCEGDVLSENNGLITALATVMIMIFTIVLARVSSRQLRAYAEASKESAADMAKSIGEAARSAKAMEDVAKSVAESANAAIAMREQIPKQMRAYVAVNFGFIAGQNQAMQNRMMAEIVLTNTGVTPAHKVRVQTRMKIFAGGMPDDFDLSLPEPPDTGGGVLNPHKPFTVSAFADVLFPEELIWLTITDLNYRVFIYGTVWYEDVFAVRRHTNFCQVIFWRAEGVPHAINTHRHNDAN